MAKKQSRKKQKSTEQQICSAPHPTLYVGVALIIIAVVVALFTFTSQEAPRNTLDAPAIIVNGEEISFEAVRNAYLTTDITGPSDQVLEVITENLILYELILQDAQTTGYAVTDAELEEIFQEFLTTQGITQEAFVQALNSSGITLEEYQEQIREEVLVNRVLADRVAPNVTQEDITRYYQENAAQFLIPEEVVVRQISLPLNLSQEELQATVNAVLTDLQSQDFCEVVQTYSLDTSCASYGITQEDAFPAYVQAAFNQEIGAITFVEGPDAYYFVQTLNRLDFNPVPLDQASQLIEQLLGQEQFQEAYTAYTQELRENAEVINTLQ